MPEKPGLWLYIDRCLSVDVFENHRPSRNLFVGDRISIATSGRSRSSHAPRSALRFRELRNTEISAQMVLGRAALSVPASRSRRRSEGRLRLRQALDKRRAC